MIKIFLHLKLLTFLFRFSLYYSILYILSCTFWVRTFAAGLCCWKGGCSCVFAGTACAIMIFLSRWGYIYCWVAYNAAWWWAVAWAAAWTSAWATISFRRSIRFGIPTYFFYMHLPLTSTYILFFRLPHTSLLPARYTNRPLDTPLLPTAMYILFFRLPRAKFPNV